MRRYLSAVSDAKSRDKIERELKTLGRELDDVRTQLSGVQRSDPWLAPSSISMKDLRQTPGRPG